MGSFFQRRPRGGAAPGKASAVIGGIIIICISCETDTAQGSGVADFSDNRIGIVHLTDHSNVFKCVFSGFKTEDNSSDHDISQIWLSYSR